MSDKKSFSYNILYKSILFLITLIQTHCSTIKFVGEPIETDGSVSIDFDISKFNKKEWYLLDIKEDSVPGMSVFKARKELIKDKKGKNVIVGIIDSGVDVNHPFLNSSIWTNNDEIPSNNIDDDKNGRVDDLNGWNFLGNSSKENMEYIRLIKKTSSSDSLYKIYIQEMEKDMQNTERNIKQIKSIIDEFKESDSILSLMTGKKDYQIEDIKKLNPKSFREFKALQFKQLADEYNWSIDLLKYDLKNSQNRLDYHFNIDFNGRLEVGDDPDNLYDINYGNANVTGPSLDDAVHGTHVSGIVLSVYDNISIMPIRAVPDGDEYDKDIALAIKYAVDNGASIINFSFGKSFSPNSDWVLSSLKYAAKNDVLIINAAGNDTKNIDLDSNKSFPTDEYMGIEQVDNMLTVGASTYNFNKDQMAYFSNYGSKNVDVFAPGYQIYSSVPDKDSLKQNKGKFKYLNGTSMAAPNVTGVAAVLRSFYPKLSAKDIKNIIIKSGVKMFDSLEVSGKENKISSSDLSVSGSVINLYNALIMASSYK